MTNYSKRSVSSEHLDHSMFYPIWEEFSVRGKIKSRSRKIDFLSSIFATREH